MTLGALASYQLPVLGANGLLHPAKREMDAAARSQFPISRYAGSGVDLEGWQVPAAGRRRGAVVYLHGIADNRGSAAEAVRRMSRQGFDVVAFDSRAHGHSGGGRKPHSRAGAADSWRSRYRNAAAPFAEDL